MATVTVNTPGSLNAAIDALATAAPGVTTIDLSADIAFVVDLEAVNLPAGVALVLDGQGHTIDGGGTHRGLSVFVGGVTVENVTLANLRARGGIGGSGAQGAGGGGAGLGGALFVAAAGTVTLNAVTFTGDAAVGGAGGTAAGGPLGGGGGMGGAGGTGADPGGGGIGQTAVGSSGGAAGTGIVPNGGSGGGTAAAVGGANGGGGAAGNAAGGAGGGIGATNNTAQFGGAGGFGGGGGAGSAMYGGGGGFGGGGGGGSATSGAAGGYGGFGGGGGGGATGGAAGFGGAAGNGKAGGGGLGAGGDIFVQTGGRLILGTGIVGAGTVTGGAGGGNAFGNGVFLMAGETLTLAPAGALTISGAITDQSGSDPGNAYNKPGTGALRLTTGTVVLGAANSFTGGITIAAAIGAPAALELGVPGAAGKGAVTFDGSANGQEILKIDGTVMPANTIAGLTPMTFLDLAGVPFAGGAHAALAGGMLTVVSGSATLALHATAADPTIPFVVENDGNGGSMVVQAPTLTAANETEFDNAMIRADLTDGVPFAVTVISLDPASGTIALTSDPYAVNLPGNARLEIRGNGATLDGGGQFRGLFAYAGALTVSNLTLANTAAIGGTSVANHDPGGGGMGAGGGLFVAANATVSLSGVSFSNARAVGGAGGNYFGGIKINSSYGSGGGGMGGEAVNYGGGGVGGGATGGIVTVGPYQWAGNPGIILAGAAGGAAGSGVAIGGASGGGGGSAGGAGGGGGVGGTTVSGQTGGQGGFGGGGGGGYLHAGAGGFGGGGGGAVDNGGANGGFGGGGGAGVSGLSGVGGFGAGAGSDFAGGGGLGAGGDIFVQQGGVLRIGGDGSLTGGTVQRGYGGLGKTAGAGGLSGQAFASGMFIQGNNTVTFDPGPGQAISIGDVTGDQSGSAVGQPGTGAIVVTGGGFVGLNAPADFTGGLTIEGGSTASLAFEAAGTGAIRFVGAGTVDLQVAPIANSFTGFGPGDAIDALGLAGSTGTYDPAANTLTLDTAGGTVPIVFAGTTYAAASFAINDSGSDLLITFACFMTGSRILTDAGEVEVERLTPGMRVFSALHRKLLPIVWIGHQALREAWPVRVCAGAFGPGRPHRDLWLSPDHAVFVDEVLVPVRYLINGVTVVQEHCKDVTYYHVELTEHGVLLAEGLPAESYLDTGNRAAFAHDGNPVQMTADFAPSVWAAGELRLRTALLPIACPDVPWEP